MMEGTTASAYASATDLIDEVDRTRQVTDRNLNYPEKMDADTFKLKRPAQSKSPSTSSSSARLSSRRCRSRSPYTGHHQPGYMGTYPSDDEFEIVRRSVPKKLAKLSGTPAASPSKTSAQTPIGRLSTCNSTTAPIAIPPSPVSSTANNTYIISKIPAAFCSQKAVFSELKSSKFFKNMTSISFRFPNSAALISTLPIPVEDLQGYIKNRMGDPAITVRPAGIRPYIQLQPRLPSYSCVITRVDLNITVEEVEEALQLQEISFTKTWRIKSRATNKETTLLRVISHNKSSIDRLLSQGLMMMLRIYRCEPSHAPPPLPLQCSRCFDYNHSAADCKKTPVCPHCGGIGCKGSCNLPTPSCLHCKGDHAAWSSKCPRKKATLTPSDKPAPFKPADEPTPPPPVDAPVSEVFTKLVAVDDFIRALSLSLINIFPDRRKEVQVTLASVMKTFFRKTVHFNYSGQLCHVTIM